MFGLDEKEIEYLKNCNKDITNCISNEDYVGLQTEVDWYLTSDDCMYYDEDGENWYTEKGKYVQSLYDKIINWKDNE